MGLFDFLGFGGQAEVPKSREPIKIPKTEEEKDALRRSIQARDTGVPGAFETGAETLRKTLTQNPLKTVIQGVAGIGQEVGEVVQDTAPDVMGTLQQQQNQRQDVLKAGGQLLDFDSIKQQVQSDIGINMSDPKQVKEMTESFMSRSSPQVQKSVTDAAAELLGINPDELSRGHIDRAQKLISLSDSKIAENVGLVSEQSERLRQLKMKLENPDTLSRGEKVSMGLAVAIPLVALALSKNANQRAAIGRSMAQAGQAIDQSMAQKAQVRSQMEGRVEELTNMIISNNNKIQQSLLSNSALSKGFQDTVSRQLGETGARIKERESVLSAGGMPFKDTGFRLGNQALFREDGLGELSSAGEKEIRNVASTLPAYTRDLSVIKQVISQVGVQADGSISGNVKVVDPITGEEREGNAAGIAQRAYKSLMLTIKQSQGLGALDKGVENFFKGIIESPVGMESFLKDVAGGQSDVIITQVDELLRAQKAYTNDVLNANGVVSESEINKRMVQGGEVPDVELIDNPTKPGHIYRVRMPDGRMATMNQASLDQLFRNLRSRRGR